MNSKKIIFTLLLLLVQVSLFAQDSVEMAFDMRASGKIYVVIAVLVVIFLGITAFLVTLERRINRLENRIRKTRFNCK